MKKKNKNFEIIETAFNDEVADIFVLPEMFSTGFCMEPEEIADRDEATLSWMKDFAQKKNAAVCGSVSIKENDKFYEIMVAEHGDMTLSAQEHRFGPYLNQEKSAVFKAKWQRELNKLQIALSHVPISHEADRFAISQKITAIKRKLI